VIACWSSFAVFGLREGFFGSAGVVSSEDSGLRASTVFFERRRGLSGAISESARDVSDSVSSRVASVFDFRARFVFNGGASSGVDGIDEGLPWLTRVDKGSWNA
jgi:hypothetical protein